MGKSKLVIFAALLSIPFTAKANIIWPSVYIVGQYYTWYVIIIGLLIEFLAIRYFLKCSFNSNSDKRNFSHHWFSIDSYWWNCC